MPVTTASSTDIRGGRPHATVAVMSTQLGHLPSAPARPGDPHHPLLYLPDKRVIVMVETRLTGHRGWRCAVIATADGNHCRHLIVTDSELDNASSSLIADPGADPDTFAVLWQARVQQHWAAPRIHTIGRILATWLRHTGTTAVHLDGPGMRDLSIGTRLQPPGVRILLRHLTDTGFLHTDTRDPTGHGLYKLHLPANRPRS